MSEDKHFRRALVLGLVISALLIGVGFWQSITMGIVCLVGCGALLAIFCLYTRNQTREIRRLSDYLTTLVNGTAPLLVPANNQEGELSLLENNIYKTARKLQTQAELMQKDKTYLADALADVSHQLKTPITSMTVMTDLLLEEDLPAEKRLEFLKGISAQLEKMQWMITTLLKISKFDAGTAVLHKEPVAAIRQFVDEQKIPTTIMYDMAHVLGLIGDHFQNPFAEGAEIVTGSTHKTFFGPQRGVIGVNYKEEDLKYGLWKTIETRTFPGSVSNHHLGTQVGMLMAAYEMNQFKDEYQKAVIANAKSFARSLKAEGLDVMGDPAIDYTETHQVIVSVGYGEGAEIANRLERNNVIVNYQATPDEEGFTASGALRMGVSEMTRFGFGEKEFAQLASLMAECILRGKEIGPDVAKLRARHLEMGYCFNDEQFETALEKLAAKAGL